MVEPDVVYLDNAASTGLRPGVLEAMLPWFSDRPANPSGAHAGSRAARRAVDDARDHVAALVGCEPGEVVFTSGGTEADNAAIDGVVARRGGRPVCSAVEHPAVLAPVDEHGGVLVAVDGRGVIDLDHLASVLTGDVSVVSVMLVNNETGVVQPLAEVADVVARHAPGAILHTDAVQGAPWLALPERCAAADLVSVTGHKFGGPKGAGALVVRGDVTLSPLLRGGGQERERRSGTQNVPAIVGLGEAARQVVEERTGPTADRVAAQRDRLEAGLVASRDGIHATVPAGVERSPAIAHVCIEGIASELLLVLLERHGVQASAASSCASGAQEPSHVLAAMGVDRTLAGGSLRLSLAADTPPGHVDRALDVIPPAVDRLRAGA